MADQQERLVWGFLAQAAETTFTQPGSEEWESHVVELRNRLDDAMTWDFMDPALFGETGVLGALRDIATTHGTFSHDVRYDCLFLRGKWLRGDFNPDPLRGIIVQDNRHDEQSDRTGLSRCVDPAWPRIPSDVFGDGHLAVGQWWPFLVCAYRDGAHGTTQGGIFGDSDKGAYSVLLNSKSHDNRDDGTVVWFRGTRASWGEMSRGTHALGTNWLTGQPVRLLRGSGLRSTNIYRPKKGFRYDGLYFVTDFEYLDESCTNVCFRLDRSPQYGTASIRCQGLALGARPNRAEQERDYSARSVDLTQDDNPWIRADLIN